MGIASQTNGDASKHSTASKQDRFYPCSATSLDASCCFLPQTVHGRAGHLVSIYALLMCTFSSGFCHAVTALSLRLDMSEGAHDQLER